MKIDDDNIILQFFVHKTNSSIFTFTYVYFVYLSLFINNENEKNAFKSQFRKTITFMISVHYIKNTWQIFIKVSNLNRRSEYLQ